MTAAAPESPYLSNRLLAALPPDRLSLLGADTAFYSLTAEIV